MKNAHSMIVTNFGSRSNPRTFTYKVFNPTNCNAHALEAHCDGVACGRPVQRTLFNTEIFT
jgi:hypothetical protein